MLMSIAIMRLSLSFILLRRSFLPFLMFLLVVLLMHQQVCCLATSLAQFGPAPPRLNIPGAIPLGVQGRAVSGGQVRRPQRPQNAFTEARFVDEAKPVVEDEEDAFQPHHQAQPAPPRALFTSEPQDDSPPQRFNQQARPAQRNFPPQQQQQQPQTVRPRAQNFHEDRAHAKPHQSEDKPKKPVAQILRKYREENPDGSITWGFGKSQ